MLSPDLLHSPRFWQLITRLGEAEILLPLALLCALAWARHADKRRAALLWMALLVLAAALTTATKVAFIGFGIGVAAINFTGISGHAMFASAIYPLLMLTLLGAGTVTRRQLALALGCALALLVAVSRVQVGAHSWSEVAAGVLVGGAVTALVLALAETGHSVLRPLVPALFLAWMALTPLHLQASSTHSLVTRLALGLSGHVQPYTRTEMLRLRAQNS